MKICKDCHQLKPYDNFVPKASCKDGYEIRCRTCRSNRYNKSTPELFFKKIYSSQCVNSVTRNHPQPAYSLLDLMVWADTQPNLASLWDAYVASNYTKDLAPSVDRLDDNKPYTLDNIQMLSWAANRKKGAQHKKLGLNNAVNRAVMAICLDGMPHKTYHSIMDAVRDVGGRMWGIVTVANGVPVKDGRGTLYQPKTYKGFIWKWVN